MRATLVVFVSFMIFGVSLHILPHFPGGRPKPWPSGASP
jgi:hypothetical protein